MFDAKERPQAQRIDRNDSETPYCNVVQQDAYAQERNTTVCQEHGKYPADKFACRDPLFRESWHKRDVVGAVQFLHQYYDHNQFETAGLATQYALLDLVAVDAGFGNINGALWASCEAIDAARESHDDGCLCFALAWFKELSRSQISGRDLDQGHGEPIQRNDSMRAARVAHPAANKSKLSYAQTTLLDAASVWYDLDQQQLSRLALRLSLPLPEHLLATWHLRLSDATERSSQADTHNDFCRTISMLSMQLDGARDCTQDTIEGADLSTSGALSAKQLPRRPNTTNAKRLAIHYMLVSQLYSISDASSQALVSAIRAMDIARRHNLLRIHREALNLVSRIVQ